MHTQNRARRDLAWYAKKEGIEKVKTVSTIVNNVTYTKSLQLQVLSRKEMNIERLQEAIDFSVA